VTCSFYYSKVEEAILFPGQDKSGCLRTRSSCDVLGVAHEKPERFSGFLVITISYYLPCRPDSDPAKVVDLHKQRVGRDLIGLRGFLDMSGADELTENYITRSACP
jgi:hypothetical protein